MFTRSTLFAQPNVVAICKSVSFLVFLLAHLLMGREVLQHNRMAALQGETPLESVASAVVAQQAPNFEGTAVVNKELVTISLSKYAGKYVVLLFYPLDFSSVCPTEVTAFSDRLDEFTKLNAQVIACSVDSPYAHLTWLDMPSKVSGLGKIRIPLLSDMTHKISQDYGVYMPRLGHSLRAQFIIDPHGIIRQATINDLFVPRSVEETLRLIKACRHADRTGQPLSATKVSQQINNGR